MWKLPLWDTPKPKYGTVSYWLVKYFVDNFNFCHGYKYDEFDQEGNPVPKPENKLYNVIYKYWTWPFVNPDCICCAAVRGVIYGAVIGFIAGRLL